MENRGLLIEINDKHTQFMYINRCVYGNFNALSAE